MNIPVVINKNQPYFQPKIRAIFGATHRQRSCRLMEHQTKIARILGWK
jgi:hypothetical protein